MTRSLVVTNNVVVTMVGRVDWLVGTCVCWLVVTGIDRFMMTNIGRLMMSSIGWLKKKKSLFRKDKKKTSLAPSSLKGNIPTLAS